MDQIQQLLEILKQTPQMALWGLGLYFLFVLLKIASWVGALSFIAKMLITRMFNYYDEKLKTEPCRRLEKILHKDVFANENLITELLVTMKNGTSYVHSSDIEKAIKLIKLNKA